MFTIIYITSVGMFRLLDMKEPISKRQIIAKPIIVELHNLQLKTQNESVKN